MRCRTCRGDRPRAFAIMLVALGVALGLPACLQHTCTEAGCTSGISAKVVGQIADANSARACLDEVCATVPWPGRGSSCEEVESNWRLSVCLDDDGAFVTLAFAKDARVSDGVKFELFVEDAGGQALLHESESVRFSDSYPNGKQCPGHCKYANYRY